MINKGREYEKKAGEFLEKEGIVLLEKNFFGNHGEIDIIGLDGSTLVFFEVKYRKNDRFGFPEEAINKKKAFRIYLTAKEYIGKKKIKNKDIRFDSITFLGEKISWQKNVFWGDEIGI